MTKIKNETIKVHSKEKKIDNWNSLISFKVIKLVAKNSPTKKSPCPGGH